jgi:diacylglycerol kinase (ATP)
MTIALMMNLKAGLGRTNRLADYVFQQFELYGLPYVFVRGDSAQDAINKVTARISEFSAVVAVGGDGSVHTAAQIAFKHKLPLGIIASGSGDDVARACGLPHGRNLEATKLAVDHFVKAWKEKDLTEIDSLSATTSDGQEHAVLAVMSCGFDSRVNANSAKMTYLTGTGRYILAMLKTLTRFSPISYHTVIDGKESKFEAMLIAIGNGSMFGGGMKVCPSANIKDGELDYIVVNKISIPTLLAVFPKVFTGKHVNHPKVDEARAKTFWLHAPGEQVWGDGEYLGESPVQIEIRPNSVSIYGVRW